MTPTDEVKKVAYDILPDGAVRSRELIRELIASAITSAVKAERERCAKVAEDMTKEQEYKTIGHLCENRCEWEREWTKKVVAQTIRQTPTKEGA